MPSAEPRDLGDYRLTSRIGSGGQGEVHRAIAPSGVEVAVKILHATLSEDDGARRRFFREVELARRVAPFCTARVLDVGVHDNQPFIVSEFVPGASLHHVVRQEGPRTGGGLERLAVATATALAAIHRAGVVHRDFKPSNVIMGPEGPVVIDFGISRALDHTVTHTGSMGTPGYMAPEQVASGEVGPAADVFSWGATMVYAAPGRPAFQGDSVPVVLHALLYGNPDISGVPDSLRPLITKCLDKSPENRPTAADLVRTLTGDDTPAPPASAAPFPGAAPVPSIAPVAGAFPVAAPVEGVSRGAAPVAGAFPSAAPVEGAFPGVAPGAGTAPPGSAPPDISSLSTANLPPTDRPSAHVSPTDRSSANPSSMDRPFPDLPSTRVTSTDLASTYASSGHPPPANGLPYTQPVRKSRRTPILLVLGSILVVAAVLAAVTLWPKNNTPANQSRTSTTLEPSTFGTPVGDPIRVHTDDVRSIAIGQLDGPISVSGSDDDTARVVDLVQGVELTPTLTGHTKWVRSVAIGTLDNEPIALTGSDDGTALVWNLNTRQRTGPSIAGNPGGIKAVALGDLDGTPIAITAGVDKTARIWDLRTREQIGAPLTGHTSTIWSVALTMLNNTPIAVTTSDDSTVRLWDLRTRKQLGAPMTGHQGWVRSVAVADLDGKPIALTGGEDNTARIWDLTTQTQLGTPLTGHTGWIWSVALTKTGDNLIALTGSEDDTARAWDISTRKLLGPPLTGHTDCIWTVTFAELNGKPIAVTGSKDETIRLWNLS
ncbi:protein kinase domain-containing protein [Acrocarpospora pleiomorpha]|uniref:protein kinase domain-containing protein n=1 Tax=Acrocarpospora pleiomorpha TaxID=90975 RepID=UPI0012D32D4D